MRTSQKTFLCCSVLAGVLLAAAAAMAQAPLPTVCQTLPTNAWTIQVTAGPCPVESATSTSCAASGAYTGIQYTVTGAADHVAALVTVNNTVTNVPGNQVYGPCEGDPVTGLGKHSCHEKAAKLNPLDQTQSFWLIVDGSKTAVPLSVVAKKGRQAEACMIAGLGVEGVNPFKPLAKTEVVKFKGCAVLFTFDPTGALASAELLPQGEGGSDKPACGGTPGAHCCSDVISANLDKLSLSLDPAVCGNPPGEPCPLGAGVFSTDAYVSTGTNTCTTRIIGGKLTTWGSPCPQ